MNKKSPLLYTYLIGLLLSVIMIAFIVLLYIGASNSGEFGSSLGGAILMAVMLVAGLVYLGLVFLTSLIAIIDYALQKRVRSGIYIALAVIYYLASITNGIFMAMLVTDTIISLPILIVLLALLVVVIILTSINLKHGIEDANSY